MAPTFQQQRNDLMAGLGTAGVGANSTVAALGESDLAAKQGATLAGEDARMIMENQQQRLNLLQGTEGAAMAQTAQDSGMGIFGSIINDIGGLATTAMGMPGFSSLFKGSQNAGLSTPSVTDVNTQPELGPISIPTEGMQTLPLG
jgi:hypothetical protein